MKKRTLIASLLFVCYSISSVAQVTASRKIDALLQMIEYAYVDSSNQEKLAEDAIRAMLKDLDPHSVYIPARELKETNEPLVGKFEGIGIQFNIFEDTIMVTQPIPGGPSEKLGIRAGDRIVKIDGTNVAGVKLTNNCLFHSTSYRASNICNSRISGHFDRDGLRLIFCGC